MSFDSSPLTNESRDSHTIKRDKEDVDRHTFRRNLCPQTPPWTSVLTSLSTGIWSGALFFFLSSPQSIGMTVYYPSSLTKLKPAARLTKLNPCVCVCVSLRQITSYKYKMMNIKVQIYQSGLPIDSRPLQPRCVTRVVMLSAARRQPRDRVLRSRGNPYESTL